MSVRPRARRGLRVLVLPTALALTAGLALTTGLAGTAAAAAPPAATRAATYGGGWIARQITPSNGFAGDVSATATAVIALHASGVGKAAATRGTAFLTTRLGTPMQSSGSDNPGRLAYVVIAAKAEGRDPRNFGGTGAQNDLVTRLLGTARTTGKDAGLFGAQDPTFDGAFRQGLALAALKAAGVPASNPKVSRGLAWLTAQQCAGGLWESYRASVATPCAAADPATFSGPDTNSTGLAVQGLAAYGKAPRRPATLAALDAVQAADGGFPYLAAAGQSSDPNSTALVVQGLLAAGTSPTAPRWTVGGKTPYAALTSFQLGCAAPVAARGAFFFPGTTDPNAFATLQAVPALAGKALPLATSTPRSVVPTYPC